MNAAVGGSKLGPELGLGLGPGARARSGGQVTPEQSVRGDRLLRGTAYSVTGRLALAHQLSCACASASPHKAGYRERKEGQWDIGTLYLKSGLSR